MINKLNQANEIDIKVKFSSPTSVNIGKMKSHVEFMHVHVLFTLVSNIHLKSIVTCI